MRSGAGAPPASDAPIPRDLEAHKSLEARMLSLALDLSPGGRWAQRNSLRASRVGIQIESYGVEAK